MTSSDAKENQEAGRRAGGNVETKGGSKDSDAEEGSTRAGGNVETKGASGGADDKNASAGKG